MAKKRNYAAEYARRIARGQTAGKTRQQARGHKVHEHVERKVRELERYGLTSDQKSRIKKWVASYPNSDRDVDEVLQMTSEKGYAWFGHYRDVWNGARKTYLTRHTRRKYSPQTKEYLRSLAEQSDIGEDNIGWLYYH